MDIVDIVGRPATRIGLALRVGQCVFAAGSLYFMNSATDFNGVTAYRLLLHAMMAIIVWSFALAFLDAYALRKQWDLQGPAAVYFFVVCWFLLVAALGSSSGVASLYVYAHMCSGSHQCLKHQISVALGWISQGLLTASVQAIIYILRMLHY
ncbi:CASP-like protein 5B3 isoform X2 [Punica granatum]|uniref:CASP-like protein n=1 Tax=Punica granatum TaxID=22663 RepID=A0A6P8EB11_PUNGR|nr:CASP-like protein 5B3 isoform X2 [Punica granatum]